MKRPCEIHSLPMPCSLCKAVHDYGDAYLPSLLKGERARSYEQSTSKLSHAKRAYVHRREEQLRAAGTKRRAVIRANVAETQQRKRVPPAAKRMPPAIEQFRKRTG